MKPLSANADDRLVRSTNEIISPSASRMRTPHGFSVLAACRFVSTPRLSGRIGHAPKHCLSETAGHVIEQLVDRQPARDDLLVERPVDRQLQALAVGLQADRRKDGGD